MTEQRTCSETREGDELVCYVPGCHLRWDAHEDRPPCPFAQRYEWPDVKYGDSKCT